MLEADALALLTIARRDLQAVQGMTDTTTFHEAVWGFQVQQTIEKALKAWLYLSGVEPPFTHDLVALLKLLEQACCDITPYRDLDRSSWNGRAEALVMSIEAMLPPPALP